MAEIKLCKKVERREVKLPSKPELTPEAKKWLLITTGTIFGLAGLYYILKYVKRRRR